MKKTVIKRAFCLSAVMSILAYIPALAQEIPTLQDVLGNMNEAEINRLESGIRGENSLTKDIDIAINEAVSDAVEEGLIGEDAVDDATASLKIINDNAEYFNFDVLEVIAEGLDEKSFTASEVRETLEGFQNLSSAGKAIVGQGRFDAATEDRAEAESLFNSLSEADKAIVLKNMPAMTKEH